MSVNLQPVNSEAVQAVGYDQGNLHVVYRSSPREYVYSGVPYATYEAMMASDSIGKFISQHIRKHFTAHEV